MLKSQVINDFQLFPRARDAVGFQVTLKGGDLIQCADSIEWIHSNPLLNLSVNVIHNGRDIFGQHVPFPESFEEREEIDVMELFPSVWICVLKSCAERPKVGQLQLDIDRQ